MSLCSPRNLPSRNDCTSSTRTRPSGRRPKNAFASRSTSPAIVARKAESIDDRGKQEAGAVVVEFDELKSALAREMEIPGAEKADLAPLRLRDRRRVAERRRAPGIAARHSVEDAD